MSLNCSNVVKRSGMCVSRLVKQVHCTLSLFQKVNFSSLAIYKCSNSVKPTVGFIFCSHVRQFHKVFNCSCLTAQRQNPPDKCAIHTKKPILRAVIINASAHAIANPSGIIRVLKCDCEHAICVARRECCCEFFR